MAGERFVQVPLRKASPQSARLRASRPLGTDRTMRLAAKKKAPRRALGLETVGGHVGQMRAGSLLKAWGKFRAAAWSSVRRARYFRPSLARGAWRCADERHPSK